LSVAVAPSPALLRWLWLASPALPVGGFSYSEGLEAAVEAAEVHDEASAATWLAQQLRFSLARSELPLLAQALTAWRAHDAPRLHELNDWALHSRESAEFRLQTEQMGRSLAEWLAQRAADEASAFSPDPGRIATLRALPGGPSWPLAFALAALGEPADDAQALQAFGFAWCEAMVQAAIKAVPLGQSAGQRLLGQLARELPALAQHALTLPDSERQCFSPRLAILSARHETQYSRLFRS
jgi:urease accessory protein